MTKALDPADIVSPETTSPAASDNSSNDAATDEISVRADMAKLAVDFREFLNAELRYYRSRLQYSASVARWASLYLFVALAAVAGAFIALILGMLLALAQWLGAIWATLIVSGGFLMIGLAFAFFAKSIVKKMQFPELDSQDD